MTSKNYNPGNQFKLTSGYGERILNGKKEFHPGLDFAAPNGTDIPSPSAGEVWYSGFNKGGYGNTVIIKGLDGNFYLLAHQNGERMPAVGTQVRRGDIVGQVGNTGLSYGNHLHYEVLKPGTPVSRASGGPVGFRASDRDAHLDPAHVIPRCGDEPQDPPGSSVGSTGGLPSWGSLPSTPSVPPTGSGSWVSASDITDTKGSGSWAGVSDITDTNGNVLREGDFRRGEGSEYEPKKPDPEDWCCEECGARAQTESGSLLFNSPDSSAELLMQRVDGYTGEPMHPLSRADASWQVSASRAIEQLASQRAAGALESNAHGHFAQDPFSDRSPWLGATTAPTHAGSMA